jgi:potassium voltage-gated channel Eag-related subfamily H protein
MIFRKVSDVKKERELAERRKDDPALNQTQDHLVRKLFSKFKKSGPVEPPPPNVIVRDVERGEVGVQPSTNPSGSGGDNNNKVTSPFMNSTSKAMNGKNKVAAAVSTQQSPINVGDVANSGTSATQSSAPPKRLTGWARLKAGSTDTPAQQQQQTNDLTESLQCNLDLLPSAKNSFDNNKGRKDEKTMSDYDSSIAEMVENSKQTQAEVKKLTERVAKMEEIISDFVLKLSAALPNGDDERHYTKRSKSKSRHHHRSSSTSGQVVSSNPAGSSSPGAIASNPSTPSNSAKVKIGNNLKLTTKNEEFL